MKRRMKRKMRRTLTKIQTCQNITMMTMRKMRKTRTMIQLPPYVMNAALKQFTSVVRTGMSGVRRTRTGL